MEYTKLKMKPSEKLTNWINEHCRERIVNSRNNGCIMGFCNFDNLKLYFGTNNVKTFTIVNKNGKDQKGKIGIQVEDNDPEILSMEEFKKKYIEPAALWFSKNYDYVAGTPNMISKFIEYCKEELGEDITQNTKMFKNRK